MDYIYIYIYAEVKDILTPYVFSTRGVYNELIERRWHFLASS